MWPHGSPSGLMGTHGRLLSEDPGGPFENRGPPRGPGEPWGPMGSLEDPGAGQNSKLILEVMTLGAFFHPQSVRLSESQAPEPLTTVETNPFSLTVVH